MRPGERLSRRSFLAGVGAAGGGLTLGIAISAEPARAGASPASPEITAWVVIRPDDTVVIRIARSEMGQGIFTGLAMLVAEELECDWAKVKAEFAPPEENFRRHRVWGEMSTGASRAIASSQQYLREAGAAAREMLIAAAAARWRVPASECAAANSVITHRPSGRRASFGEVAAAAAALAPPATVKLKDPKEWKLIGTPRNRLEILDKVTAQPIYAIDVRLPGMLYAAIVHCPVFGGRLQAVDETALKDMPGIRRVIRLPDAVAVVAESWWQAKRAAERLPVIWDSGANARASSATIGQYIREGLDAADAKVARAEGDVASALAGAARRVEADYAVPFLAHATMEPQTCTAHVTADGVEIWAPTQDGETALLTAASAARVPAGKVVVHKMMLGGGFGRRGTVQDFVREAVLIAREVDAPVKLVWTREEDIRHDQYRPLTMARLTAGLDADGAALAWKIRLAGPTIVSSLLPQMSSGGIDRNFLQGLLEEMAYVVPNLLLDYAVRRTHVPLGVWRSVNYMQNAFFVESFVDEMAHAAGQDPYLYRRNLLRTRPAHLAVLDAAAKRAGWGEPPAAGVSRGIALFEACGSICAHVVEISLAGGRLRVQRVVCALDCGYVVNPLSVEMQCEGGVVFALTAALTGEISIKDGAVVEGNFDDYEMLRMADMPKVETVLVPSGGFWGGVGEPPMPPLAPALCNAIFAATGKRIRSLPLKHHELGRA